MSEDSRNVIDKYKGWMQDLIREDLKKKSFPFAVLCSQIAGDFNFSSVIRSANFFGASEVFYYGRKKYDKRGTQGTHHYTHVQFLSTPEEIKALKNKYVFVGLENNINKKTCPIQEFDYPSPNILFLVGEEGTGLSDDILELCDYYVEIPGFGSVRSLNLGCAASISFYDYVSKFKKFA